MKYLLLQYANEAAMRNLTREEAVRMHTDFTAYVEAMKWAGVLLANHGLRPTSEAQTMRAPGGKKTTADGPYTETKERLGGYFPVDVPDREAALAWAVQCPAASHGAIEVRPVWA